MELEQRAVLPISVMAVVEVVVRNLGHPKVLP